MVAMAVMAVIVFIALFYFKAGYGYLSTSNWGPKIGNKTAWVLMEAPAFCFMLYYTIDFALSGAETGNSKAILFIMAGFYLLHYFQRSFIFPLMMRGKSTMPIAIMLMGLVFNTLNAYRGTCRNVSDRLAVEPSVHHRNNTFLCRHGHQPAF